MGADTADDPDFLFSKKYLWENQTCYVRKPRGRMALWGTHSLSNKQLGIIGNYAYSEELDQYIANHKNSHKVQE